MNQELIEKLRASGFPDGKKITEGQWFFVPALAELIKGVHHFSHNFRLEAVRDNPGVWAAATCWGNGHEDDWEKGSTPEEAVGRLFLRLADEYFKEEVAPPTLKIAISDEAGTKDKFGGFPPEK